MATMLNGASNTSPTDTNPATGSMSNNGKSAGKLTGNAGNKHNDGGRRQSGNPGGDGASRRSAQPKAWQSGVNPITHRSNLSNNQNGAIQQGKPPQRMTGLEDSGSAEKVANERLLNLLANSMGSTASITVQSGDVFSGLFFGANTENQDIAYVLKMVQQTKFAGKGDSVNGVRDRSHDYVGNGEDYTMFFQGKDVLGVAIEGVSFMGQEKQLNGSAGGFRTDTDISSAHSGRERELQRWTSSGNEDTSLALEDSNGASWDQFQANEKLFGVKSDYDETFYTTAIDRGSAQYRQNEARAQRIAREIEGETSNSAHVKEERGFADENGDIDEEEKYSGVRRNASDYPPLQSNPNRYMPPARRPPSGQPTVAGAPVDPAIISSQIAKPDDSPQRKADVTAEVAPARVPAKVPDVDPVELKNDSPKDGAHVKAPNATTNVETEVLGQFKNFAMGQKLKVANEKRERMQKDVRLNDLKGFSKNFKLHTPVPNDLVPILAKDKKKQHEIIEKARIQAEENPKSPPKAPQSVDESTSNTRPVMEVKRENQRAAPTTADRTDFVMHRQQYPPRGPQATQSSRDRNPPGSFASTTSPPSNPGYLSHRLAETTRAHKNGTPITVPPPLPIQAGPNPPSRSGNAGPAAPSQTSSTVRTPTSATSTKFNVQATEFKPNPAASAFKPTAPSPRGRASTRGTPVAASATDFFGGKKPLPASERPAILDYFNPLRRLREKAETDGKSKDYSANGGIVYAHATPVTWSSPRDDEDTKSYKDIVTDLPATTGGASPQNANLSSANASQAHLHQLPPHLQQPGMVPGPGPHNGAYPMPQPNMYHGPGTPHNFEDQRGHGSPSGSNYPTTRMQNNFVAYPAAMGPAAQYAYGQPLPPHMIAPGGGQPMNFRQYSNGPQYMPSPGQQLAAPMMVAQGSQGSYMGPQALGMPNVPVYGPSPTPPYGGPSQNHNGYPSPGRGAPMMVHQGSYQGHAPPIHPSGSQYGQQYYLQQQPPHLNHMRGYPSPQPHYSHSPQQHYNYPPQPTRMANHGYGVPPQGGSSAAAQPGPPTGAAAEGNETMK